MSAPASTVTAIDGTQSIGSDPTTGHPIATRESLTDRHGDPVGTVSFSGIVRSEWIKFRSLRSSWLILSGAVLAMIALGGVIGYVTGTNWDTLAVEDSAPSGGLQGVILAQLLIAVLGVLLVTSEYGTGMVRSTMVAAPRRIPVVAAKALVYGAIATFTMVPASFAGYGAAQVVLSSYGHATSITSPGVLRVIVLTGVYLALVGLLGSAIGWLTRSTAGGITTVLGLLLVAPGISALLPGSLGTTLGKYLPGSAGDAFITSVAPPDSLGRWAGFAVLCCWVGAGLALAASKVRRRDV